MFTHLLEAAPTILLMEAMVLLTLEVMLRVAQLIPVPALPIQRLGLRIQMTQHIRVAQAIPIHTLVIIPVTM
jgi:hypothetical protein